MTARVSPLGRWLGRRVAGAADGGSSPALQAAVVVAVGVAAVIPFSPTVDGDLQRWVQCLGQRTLIAFEASGGQACGGAVGKTRLSDLSGGGASGAAGQAASEQ